MGNFMRVLMTGAGAPGGPGIINALKECSNTFVIGADMNSNASGKNLCDEFIQIPSADHPDFTSKILSICIEKKIDAVLPLVTKELLKLSKSRDYFSTKNIFVCVSDLDALTTLNDKGLLYEHLEANNLEHPDFRVVDNCDDFLAAVKELGYPDQPVVMKPCLGNGSRGIRVLNENNDSFDMLFNNKPSSLYSNLSTILDAFKGRKIPRLVVSEYLPGDELTIDTLVEKNQIKKMAIRTRDTINSGISTSGKFIADEEVRDYIESIVESFSGLRGPIGFQVKKSISGKFLLLESNPRIQGTSVAALGVGINFPLLALSTQTSLEKWDKILPSRVRFSRYYSESFSET